MKATLRHCQPPSFSLSLSCLLKPLWLPLRPKTGCGLEGKVLPGLTWCPMGLVQTGELVPEVSRWHLPALGFRLPE